MFFRKFYTARLIGQLASWRIRQGTFGGSVSSSCRKTSAVQQFSSSIKDNSTANAKTPGQEPAKPLEALSEGNFVRKMMLEQLGRGDLTQSAVFTRFPPEPNGHLHLGHSKAICFNFELANQFGGQCNLRFDDTNPNTATGANALSIQQDIQWLGYQWQGGVKNASDYFDQLHMFAVALIKAGHAYVCSLNAEEIRTTRGSHAEPGVASPYRLRSVEENLELFEKMTRGEFEEGCHTLRAKINMASPIMCLRDPPIYRIRHSPHYRENQLGKKWFVFPLYDFAHCLSDLVEGISHSLCTLEFENNRALYDWFIERVMEATGPGSCENKRPYQTEYSRMAMEHTVLSKRILAMLVRENIVDGWSDPRMPTLSGMRRRGVGALAVRNFCAAIGVTRDESVAALSLFEHFVRTEMESSCHRVMCVFRPLRVVIENFPPGLESIELNPSFHPKQQSLGSRKLFFTREIYISHQDFHIDPPKGFKRLFLGGEVRLRYSFIMKCVGVERSETGEIMALRCTIDHDTLGKHPADRKVKGVVHWVSKDLRYTLPCQIRLYKPLFLEPNISKMQMPATLNGLKQIIDPQSATVINGCFVERGVTEFVPPPASSPDKKDSHNIQPSSVPRMQFEREGFFAADPRLSIASEDGFHWKSLTFHRTVPPLSR